MFSMVREFYTMLILKIADKQIKQAVNDELVFALHPDSGWAWNKGGDIDKALKVNTQMTLEIVAEVADKTGPLDGDALRALAIQYSS